MTLHELQRRLKGFDLLTEVAESVAQTSEEIEDLNRGQLLRGLDSEGNFLSPKYSEDTYFKSPESAKRYAEWKKRIEPKSDKPFDVPNLYINGRFHNSILTRISKTEIKFSSNDPSGDNIESKFSRKIYGLNEETKANEYIPNMLFPLVKERVEKKLGLKFQ